MHVTKFFKLIDFFKLSSDLHGWRDERRGVTERSLGNIISTEGRRAGERERRGEKKRGRDMRLRKKERREREKGTGE